MKSPSVSVVMGVYNGERHLAASIESILAQTLSDFELIVVNDGSRDGSRNILEGYERLDRRVRVIDQENTGLTRALIRGCSEACGAYLARQDCDDLSVDFRLETQVDLLERTAEAMMASCWANYIGDNGDLLDVIKRPVDVAVATRDLLYNRRGPPAHGTVMMRRDAYEAVGGYRACFYYGQDSDLWLRLAQRGPIAYVGEVLYHARVAADGISALRSDWQQQFGELGQRANAARLAGEPEDPFLLEAENLCRLITLEKRDPRADRQFRAAAYYRMGTMLSRRGNRRSREYFWSAIRANPWHWRSWCRLGIECVCPRVTKQPAPRHGHDP